MIFTLRAVFLVGVLSGCAALRAAPACERRSWEWVERVHPGLEMTCQVDLAAAYEAGCEAEKARRRVIEQDRREAEALGGPL